MASVLAVCVVHALVADSGPIGVTAIDKRPTTARVRVGRYGLRGDVQADRKHHGGLDQAVYVYAQEDAEHWAAELGRPVPAGWFGENLRVAGVDPAEVRAGERWLVGGETDGLLLEATYPREPCATFARWVGGREARGWVKRFGEAGRHGAYFRVLRTGTVGAGDPIERLPAPEDALTMRELFRP